MVGTLQPPCLSVSSTEWRRYYGRMKPLGWKNQIVSPSRDEPSFWGARPEQNLPRSHGLESQKISGYRTGIFLDFAFYRTIRDLRAEQMITIDRNGP
jgi:hypothetical protein